MCIGCLVSARFHYLYHFLETPNVLWNRRDQSLMRKELMEKRVVWFNGTQNRLRVDVTSNLICDTFSGVAKYTVIEQQISRSKGWTKKTKHTSSSFHRPFFFLVVDETQTVMVVVRIRIYIISNIHQLRFISLTNVVHAGCVRRPKLLRYGHNDRIKCVMFTRFTRSNRYISIWHHLRYYSVCGAAKSTTPRENHYDEVFSSALVFSYSVHFS